MKMNALSAFEQAAIQMKVAFLRKQAEHEKLTRLAAANVVVDRLSSSGFAAVKPITHKERDMVEHLKLIRSMK